MTAVRAATYRRISDDREGDELGVQRQAEDIAAFVKERGYTLVEGYTDNDISASTKARKRRPDYERLLEDARAGRFDIVVAYTSSRLTRRPRENEDLIDLSVNHGVRFEYLRSPSFDLNTADGRQVARTLAASDAGEAERIAERVKRRAVQRAKNGEWQGGAIAPFGYRFVRDERGKISALEVDESRAELVREAATRLLSGDSLYAIANDWAGRGIETSKGSHWRPATLRRMLLSPSVIGCRVYRVADVEKVADVPDDELFQGWDPIIDRATWRSLRDLFRLPDRKTFTPVDGSYAGKRALNRLTYCELCKCRMIGHKHRGQPRYVCDKLATGGCGKVTINYAQLEAFIAAAIYERLDSDEFVTALDKTPEMTKAEAKLRQDLRELETERKNVLRAFDKGWRSEAETSNRMSAIQERQTKLSDRLGEFKSATLLAGINAENVHEVWLDADIEKQRRLVASLVERIEIKPFPKGVTTTPTQKVKQGESDADFILRKAVHTEGVLRERVVIKWRDQGFLTSTAEPA